MWRAHSGRTCGLGLLLADAVAPHDVDDPQLALGFVLHDVGKLALPDAVLAKRGPLTEAELALIQTHPREGWRMLAGRGYGERTREVVLHHHERWDGGGYPDGLHGEGIPPWARIVAIADAVDAMTSDRPYRPALTLPAALDELRAGAGTQFDPRLAEAFLDLDRDRIAAYTAAARSVASKSVRGIGPTHGEVVPAVA